MGTCIRCGGIKDNVAFPECQSCRIVDATNRSNPNYVPPDTASTDAAFILILFAALIAWIVWWLFKFVIMAFSFIFSHPWWIGGILAFVLLVVVLENETKKDQ